MVGTAGLRLPHVGSAVNLVRQPIILAGLAAAVMVTLVLARPLPPGAARTRRRRAGSLAPTNGDG